MCWGLKFRIFRLFLLANSIVFRAISLALPLPSKTFSVEITLGILVWYGMPIYFKIS
ncbi:TPA: hypothetical protein DD455_02410 [Candidatus Shapirobacteria bacterium]|nr:hypothetical protein [Candidatus Shapirobacteria bacterium]